MPGASEALRGVEPRRHVRPGEVERADEDPRTAPSARTGTPSATTGLRVSPGTAPRSSAGRSRGRGRRTASPASRGRSPARRARASRPRSRSRRGGEGRERAAAGVVDLGEQATLHRRRRGRASKAVRSENRCWSRPSKSSASSSVIASRSCRIRFVLASTARIPRTLKPAKRTRKPIVTPIASRGQSVSRRQRRADVPEVGTVHAHSVARDGPSRHRRRRERALPRGSRADGR